MRLAVRSDLEVESLFLARDIDDEGPSLALVVQPHRAHDRRQSKPRSSESNSILIPLPSSTGAAKDEYANMKTCKYEIMETTNVLRTFPFSYLHNSIIHNSTFS